VLEVVRSFGYFGFEQCSLVCRFNDHGMVFSSCGLVRVFPIPGFSGLFDALSSFGLLLRWVGLWGVPTFHGAGISFQALLGRNEALFPPGRFSIASLVGNRSIRL